MQVNQLILMFLRAFIKWIILKSDGLIKGIIKLGTVGLMRNYSEAASSVWYCSATSSLRTTMTTRRLRGSSGSEG